MTLNNTSAKQSTVTHSASTVIPNGEKVREKRQRHGWTQEGLAERVGCVKKTIENAEKGRPVRLNTLEEVAQALGCKPEDLIFFKEPPPIILQPGTHTVIELVLDRPFDSFTDEEQEKFLRALGELFSLTGDVRVLSRRPGSVVLVLELTAEDGDLLFREGVLEGRFEELGVVAAQRLGETDPTRGTWTYHPRPHPLPGPHPVGEHRKCSLLVVDDEPAILDMLEHLLSSEFEVLTAGDADAAEAVFGRRPVDIILTDQKMPRSTGVQLLEWVQQHHPRTIRLLMTGYWEFDDAVEAINRGQIYYFLSKPCRPEELLVALRNAAEKFDSERTREQLLENLRQSNRELVEANRQLVQQTRALEQAALTDSLTGLWNRRYIEDLARFELRRHLRCRGPLSIGLLQVERIDPAAGDDFRSEVEEVLEELSGILAGSLREIDSVGRLYGEKFLIVARETGAEGAARLSERIQAQVAATPFKYKGQLIPIALSIGFAVAEAGFAVAEAGVQTTFEAMLSLASTALAGAKTAGRNRFAVRRLSRPAS